MPDLATLVVDVLFGLLFAWALWIALRRRDALARDVTLVFAPITFLLATSLAQPIVGPYPSWFRSAVTILLLAQPVFSLRLVADIRAIPRLALPVAVTAFALAALALVGGGSRPPLAITLGAVGVFVVTELVAAGYLAAEARRRSGAARMRLAVAALATASVAASIFAVGVSAAGPGSAPAAAIASRIVAVLAAVGYCVAFLPPERLRRLWEATAAYRHSERLYAAPSSASPSVLWTDLANTAAQLTGTSVVVLESMPTRDRDEAGPTAIAAASADLDVATGVPVAMPGVGNAEAESAERALLALTGRRVAITVQIGDGASGQAIVLLRDRPSLFDADDSSLVRALAIRSADLVARRRALAEQERLAAQLAETVTALEGASAAKSDFLASMSHELRTPLNAIIGFSELMIREPGEDVTVPREWVERIRTQGGHLVALINDLLDLAKIEAGHLEIAQEPVLLAAAVEESVAGVKPLADRKNQVVDVQVDGLVVSADPGRLRQVLYNLLSNAIKFTPDGGRIEVRGEIGDGAVRLRVADNGVGIAAESLGAIFQEFEQVGETSAREGGTGLGLALTRRIVEAHGGHIEVESELGRGSCFTVVLSPATIDHAAVVIDPEDDDSPWSGDEVLIIEDDPSSLRLLETYLAGGPYIVRGAPTGAAGLAHARRHRPAAILLDILLPDMDGWEVLRQLKSDEQLREVPVVIVTVVDERSVGLALGAADYLLKPIEPVTLLHALERVGLSPRTRTEAAIVAIDDEPVVLDLLEANLRPLGYTVVRAGSGDAGLRAASTMHPDLVICDLMMPGMDGFEVVARLKENGDTAAIPILILTAHDLTGEEKARLNGRILGVVTKGEAAATGLQKWLAQAVGQALNVSGAPA